MAVSAARVSVADTATALFVADTGSVTSGGGAYSVVVKNKHASASCYLGGSDVTAAAGYELAAGEAIAVDVIPGDILYGITASGSVTAHVLRLGVG